MEKLGSIIAKLLKAHEKRLSEETLRIRWHEIVGEKIAIRSYPLRIERGILKVAVRDGIWAKEFQLREEEFLGLLKEYNIEGVRFIPMPQIFLRRK